MPTAGEPTGLLAGRFRVGQLLGSGGSASVFEAHDIRSAATVALKVLHPHLSARPEARAAFLSEARRTGGVRDPNLVSVIDFGIDDAPPEPVVWLALELVRGVSLAEYVELHGALRVDAAIAMAEGVLGALEAVHEAGLVHRDVSPANIIIEVDGSGALAPEAVRLVDFGSSDAAGRTALASDTVLSAEATGRSGVLGNVGYLSPEQAKGEPVDERGDVYQVGAAMYFALIGRAPFVRSEPAQTMLAHVETPPPVPSVTDRRIPRALDRIVVRAMLKVPDDRFASASDMRRALAELRRAEPAPQHAPIPDRTTVTRVLGTTALSLPGAPARTTVDTMAPPLEASPRRWAVVAWIAAAVAVVAIIATATYAASTSPPVAVATPAGTPSPSVSHTPSPSATSVAPAPTIAAAAVPPLAMLTLPEAREALESAGLRVGDVTETDSTHPAGVVLRSSPGSGDGLRRGDSVSLVVASGSNVVPGVAGLSQEDAAAAVKTAGFVAVIERSAHTGAPGAVLGSSPGRGTSIRLGERVTILVAAPKPAPSPTPPPPTPTSTPEPTPLPTGTPEPSAAP